MDEKPVAALVTVPEALTAAFSVEEAQARLDQLRAFVQRNMVEGVDYGQIPGTDRKSLWKPGAEKLTEMYLLTPTFTLAEKIENWESGFFMYRFECELLSRRTGAVIARGVGSCNNLEAKYRYRWVSGRDLPEEERKNTASRRRKNKLTNEWFVQYRIPNDDPFSQANTILKMAKKRAFVDAVLGATRSSGMFTQDLDEEDEQEAEVAVASGGGHQQRAGRAQAATRQRAGGGRRQGGHTPSATERSGPIVDVAADHVPLPPEPPGPRRASPPAQPASEAARPVAEGPRAMPANAEGPRIPETDRRAVEELASALGESPARIAAITGSLQSHEAATDLLRSLARRVVKEVPNGESWVRMVCGDAIAREALADPSGEGSFD